jgi:hypothetical protein
VTDTPQEALSRFPLSELFPHQRCLRINFFFLSDVADGSLREQSGIVTDTGRETEGIDPFRAQK